MISDTDWMKRVLSHNARMPMAIITGYGELLRQGMLSCEEQQEVILDICENISYLNEILRVALESDLTEETVPERVDVVETVERMSRYVAEILRKVPIEVSIQAAQPHLYIEAAPPALMRIFYQLFENAAKYMEGGGKITIRIYTTEEREILIVFKDDGVGLSEQETAHVLERGFRGSNGQGKAGGGFGLYDIKQIVERYRGTVEISSREHAGFTVYLLFPMARDAAGREGKDRADGTDIIG